MKIPSDLERIAIIYDALKLLSSKFHSPAAVQMLAAIAYQESNYEHRRQIKGPARGFWQFERGGGVVGVMNHPSSKQEARNVCSLLVVKFDAQVIYDTLEYDDVLACAFARLLLWTDPRPLPADEKTGWDYYIRNWRPGKPHLNRWPGSWEKAKSLLTK